MLTIFISVDETGKKIRGRADEKVKDYDQFGKKKSKLCISGFRFTKNIM